jgi:hypothetical protein
MHSTILNCPLLSLVPIHLSLSLSFSLHLYYHLLVTLYDTPDTSSNMSTYADIAAQNAPLASEQPKPDPGLLEGGSVTGTTTANPDVDSGKVNVVPASQDLDNIKTESSEKIREARESAKKQTEKLEREMKEAEKKAKKAAKKAEKKWVPESIEQQRPVGLI